MILDIFDNDAFSLVSMSEAIDQVEYVPNGIMGSGVINDDPIRTEDVAIEIRKGTISIVDFSKRGQERENRDKSIKANLIKIPTPRLALTSTIRASELAFLREFGTEDQIKEVQKEISRRQFGPNGLVADIDLSVERMALSSIINGNILDASGNVLYDYFSLMGMSESPDITLALSTLSGGALRVEITQKVLRPMRAKAYGAQFQNLRAICGKNAFDLLNKNPEYIDTYRIQQQGQELRDTYFEKPVMFAGCEWVEYQPDNDDVVKVGDNDIHFVPWGRNNIYSRVMSPGESFDMQGTLGQALYSSVIPDLKRNEFVELDVTTYSLVVNKRPDMKIKCGAS